MTKEFYDGKIRPNPISFDWSQEEMDRRCLNCGKRFGSHLGYVCHDEG